MGILRIMNQERIKNKITFETITQEWLKTKKKSIKISTYSNYKYAIEKYLVPKFKKYTIKKLEKYDFSEYIDELKQQYATKTSKDIIVKLKSVLYFARKEYNAKIDFENIVTPHIDRNPINILTKNEKNKLQKYCLRKNTLITIGIIICLNTGLRIGEICALKWYNIDLEKREIRVRKTLQRIYNSKTGRTSILIDKPKTRTSIRNIPISNKLYDILIILKKEYEPNDYFLTGETENYVEPRYYQKLFKRILKDSQIKKNYKFHNLRHTFATNCVEVGMDIKSLSEILGHSSVEITLNRYVHSSFKNKKRYLEKL